MTQVDKTVLDAINEKIMTIPWVKTLDQNSQLERIRATTVFPLLPPGQFIYKTIFAEDKFLIVHWLDRTEEVLHSAIYFGPNLEGPPHSAHGGAIATVLDQVVGNIAIAVLGFCVTGSLTVNYHAPVPLKGVYYCEAWIDRVEGKKRFVKAVLKENRESKKIYSSAEAVMVHIDISKFKNDNAPENKAKL